MKHLLCLLFGHKPRGPVKTHINSRFTYICTRCERFIYFDREKGWREEK